VVFWVKLCEHIVCVRKLCGNQLDFIEFARILVGSVHQYVDVNTKILLN